MAVAVSYPSWRSLSVNQTEDLNEWTEINWLEYLRLMRNDEMEATELLDYTNCWQWEIIGDALVFKRIAEPDESYLRARYAPGKFNEYEHCRLLPGERALLVVLPSSRTGTGPPSPTKIRITERTERRTTTSRDAEQCTLSGTLSGEAV
ncbi:hypothetical protein ACLB1N_34295 [Escherichia coli]